MNNIIVFTTVVLGLLLLFFGILFVSKPFYIGKNTVTVVARINAHASLLMTAVVITVQGILMGFGERGILDGIRLGAYWLTELLVALIFCIGLIVVDMYIDWFDTLDLKLFKGATFNEVRHSTRCKSLCVVGIVVLTTASSSVTLLITHIFF